MQRIRMVEVYTETLLLMMQATTHTSPTCCPPNCCAASVHPKPSSDTAQLHNLGPHF